jgi:non-ribosomal peptide synthetase-like protein
MGRHIDTREELNRPAFRKGRTLRLDPVLVSAASDQSVRWHSGERLDQLFEDRCDRLRLAGLGDHLAVDAAELVLTYDQLDGRANQLARYLLNLGVLPGDRIALLFDHAVYSYIGMLAVLKAHAAYVPLDVAFPPDRLSYIVNDAGVSMVLSLSHLKGKIPDISAQFVCLDEDQEAITAQEPTRLSTAERGEPAEELCYIIYTSGSTGRPKGVAIEHSSICNFVRVASDIYGISADDRVYQGMTIAFDFSVEEIWVSWMAGATLIPKIGGTSLLGSELGEFLQNRRVTALCCVPTLLATLEEDVAGLRFLLVSGEACPQDLMARWHRPDRRFLNVYGPTEATVTATWAVVDPERPATLGVPLPSYSAVILDPEENVPVPPGEMGEICLAGVGLARGYVNRVDLTERAFIPDFLGIANNPPARIYRTGDLGRITVDGEIEYHGRIDTQVKIRGYRIELAEVESVLLQMPGIAQAAAGTYDPEPGMTELVAYYSLRRGVAAVDQQLMHEQLRGMLPGYMVPAYFQELEALPMLPSDKVDRKRLPEPTGPRVTGRLQDFVAPSTATEKVLAHALAGVLGTEQVSAEAHFFNDLGTNSMIMAKFCARVRGLGTQPSLSMKDTYLQPTIRSLAAVMEAKGTGRGSPEADAVPAPAGVSRRATTLEYVLCGILQALLYVGASFAAALLVLIGSSYTSGGQSYPEVFERSVLFGIFTFVALCTLPIIAKWLLIGRWKVQEIPVWTLEYFRFWLVKTLLRGNPMRLFAGSPLYTLYLRALGAHIGKRVAIFSADVPVCTDLLTVGAGTVIRKDSTFSCYRAIRGVIQTGTVTIGRNAFIGEGTALDVGASVGDDSQLGHASALHAGQAVPSGERWHGSPAQRTQADYRKVEPADCSTRRRVSYSIFMLVNRLVLIAPVGIGALVSLIQQYVATDHLDHTRVTFYLDLAVISFILVFGAIVSALVMILTVPRLLILLVKTNRTYPLYGIRYAAQRTVSRMTNLKFFMQLTGDSSLIVHYVRLLGYKQPEVQQTGSNFGAAMKHESPYLNTIGKGTMIADGLSMMNAEFSSSSFKLSRVEISTRNFVGNNILFPAGARLGDNVLLGTKAMVPIDGPIREGVGLVGSPSFEIPRSVQRDARFEDFKSGEKLRKGLAAKNRHNALTIILFLLVRWFYIFVTLLIFSFAVELAPVYDVLAITGAFFAIFVFSMIYFVLIERASLGFKRLQTTFCSIYERPFWRHERFWKLSGAGYLGLLSGTPFKSAVLRLLGVRVGRRVFDDGCGIPEKSLVSIGDECTLNAYSVIQCHSMEDGAFKVEGITIGPRCTLAVKAFIHYGVTIGDGAVIEADSFLMKGEEVPAYGRFGGNPASPMSPNPWSPQMPAPTEPGDSQPGGQIRGVAYAPSRDGQ